MPFRSKVPIAAWGIASDPLGWGDPLGRDKLDGRLELSLRPKHSEQFCNALRDRFRWLGGERLNRAGLIRFNGEDRG